MRSRRRRRRRRSALTPSAGSAALHRHTYYAHPSSEKTCLLAGVLLEVAQARRRRKMKTSALLFRLKTVSQRVRWSSAYLTGITHGKKHVRPIVMELVWNPEKKNFYRPGARRCPFSVWSRCFSLSARLAETVCSLTSRGVYYTGVAVSAPTFGSSGADFAARHIETNIFQRRNFSVLAGIRAKFQRRISSGFRTWSFFVSKRLGGKSAPLLTKISSETAPRSSL